MKQLKREQLAKIPFGLRQVPEEERVLTLKNLIEAEAEVGGALERYPIMIQNVHRSEKMIRDREQLEDKFVRIQHAIKVYQKPVVYVNINK